MAKIKDESTPEGDAELLRQRRTHTDKQDTGPNDFSVTGRIGAQRDGHPDGWQTGGRGDNNR